MGKKRASIAYARTFKHSKKRSESSDAGDISHTHVGDILVYQNVEEVGSSTAGGGQVCPPSLPTAQQHLL